MLGFTALTNSKFPKLVPIGLHNKTDNINFSSYSFLRRTKTQKNPSRFVLSAQSSNRDGDKVKEQEQPNGTINGEDSKKDQLPLFSFRWGEILDPDPDNLFAVGLTGLLTWASVQVLWQLLVISLAILVAALKYSFIAALLIIILITLL